MRTPDSLDYTFALVVAIIAVLVFAAAGAVVRFHSRAQAVAPRKHGLLVWHIVSIASGTAGTWALILLGQLDIMGLVSTPRAFRLIGYSVTGSLTFAAIVIIAVSTRRRISQADAEPTTVEVRKRRSITFRDD